MAESDREVRRGDDPGGAMEGGDVLVLAGRPTRVRRIREVLKVNGEEVGYFADQVDREILVRDDGDPDALVMRTARAVGTYLDFTDGEAEPADGCTPADDEKGSGQPTAPTDASQLGSTESDGGAARPAA